MLTWERRLRAEVIHLMELFSDVGADPRISNFRCCAPPDTVVGMASRRSIYDPLQATREMRWYEVTDRHGRLLETRPLPPGTDIKRTFVAAMLEHIDAGWQLSEFSSRSGAFFCDRGNDRRQVLIVAAEPGTPTDRGAAHLCWSPDVKG
jgi:hypothetical protein